MASKPRSRRQHRPRAIEQAVVRAANVAEWLEDSDQAAVRVARRLAETLDDLYQTREGQLLPEMVDELAGRTTYVAQTLLRTLVELGLTANSRDALGYGSRRETDDALAEVRAALADVVPLKS
jgi:hypothetical protein